MPLPRQASPFPVYTICESWRCPWLLNTWWAVKRRVRNNTPGHRDVHAEVFLDGVYSGGEALRSVRGSMLHCCWPVVTYSTQYTHCLTCQSVLSLSESVAWDLSQLSGGVASGGLAAVASVARLRFRTLSDCRVWLSQSAGFQKVCIFWRLFGCA